MRVPTTLAVALLAASAGCASLENRMVYHPRPFNEAAEAEGSRPTEIELTTPSGKKICARWYPQTGSRGATLNQV